MQVDPYILACSAVTVIVTIWMGFRSARSSRTAQDFFVSRWTRDQVPQDVRAKMLVLHAPEKLGLKQEYIQEHQHGH